MNFIKIFFSCFKPAKKDSPYCDFYEQRRESIEAQKVEIIEKKMRGIINVTKSTDTSKPVQTIVIAESYRDFLDYISVKGIEKQTCLCICSERNLSGINLDSYSHVFVTELANKNGIGASVINEKCGRSKRNILHIINGSQLYVQPENPGLKFFKDEMV